MAKHIVNCVGCGRDVNISGAKSKQGLHYCRKCVGDGRSHIREQKDRSPIRPPTWFTHQSTEDDYGGPADQD